MSVPISNLIFVIFLMAENAASSGDTSATNKSKDDHQRVNGPVVGLGALVALLTAATAALLLRDP